MSWDAIVHTDGSCWDGYGGAAAILVNARTKKRILVTRGEMEHSTNQRMELLAAIIALDRLWWNVDFFKAARLRSRKRVIVYSDSAYLVNSFKDGWIENWRRGDWRTAAGKPVKNRELWETLENLVVQYRKVLFVHIHGHSGNPLNELADEHAVKARISMAGRAARLRDEPRGDARVGRRRRSKLKRPRA